MNRIPLRLPTAPSKGRRCGGEKGVGKKERGNQISTGVSLSVNAVGINESVCEN